MLVIDGRDVSWEEFGRMLMTFEGFQFKLEIVDKSSWRADGFLHLAEENNSDAERVRGRLAAARKSRGLLLGKAEMIGLEGLQPHSRDSLTQEALTTSAIEGERLDPESVRSSIARRLGLDTSGPPISQGKRNIEGLIDVLQDATLKTDSALTLERLCSWHGALFSTGFSGMQRIDVGAMRSVPVEWMLEQMSLASEFASCTMDSAIQRIRFQAVMSTVSLNERQHKTMKKLLDAGPKGFQGGMTTRKQEQISQTSTPTAARDLIELERLGLLKKYGAGRSTRYYPAIEGWAEDDAKLVAASGKPGEVHG